VIKNRDAPTRAHGRAVASTAAEPVVRVKAVKLEEAVRDGQRAAAKETIDSHLLLFSC
jgi:hypothetical protein